MTLNSRNMETRQSLALYASDSMEESDYHGRIGGFVWYDVLRAMGSAILLLYRSTWPP